MIRVPTILRLRVWKRLLIIGFLAVFSATTAIAPAHALDRNQRGVFNNNILYFNYSTANACGGGSDADTTLTGADNQEKAYNYFVKQGLSPEQSAGLVGNLVAESHLDPEAYNPAGPAHGIVQWLEGARWDTNGEVNGNPGNLVAYATQQNKETNDFATQLGFAWIELNNGYKPVLEALQASTTVADAAYVIKEQYEIPDTNHDRDSPENTNRRNLSQEIFDKFSNGAGGNAGTAASSNCDDDDVTNCKSDGTGTSASAILCEARKFDPWGYLFGGGHGDPEQFMKDWDAKGGFDFGDGPGQHPFERVVDCSGLITVALWNAFRIKVPLTAPASQGELDALEIPNFEVVPIQDTKPGDLVFKPSETGHVEIVASDGAASTFGAHSSSLPNEAQVSDEDADAAARGWTKAYHYIGAGAND